MVRNWSRITQTETLNGSAIAYAYSYDEFGRLTQVANGVSATQENYSYDPLNNRTMKSIGQTSPTITAYVYDAPTSSPKSTAAAPPAPCKPASPTTTTATSQATACAAIPGTPSQKCKFSMKLADRFIYHIASTLPPI